MPRNEHFEERALASDENCESVSTFFRSLTLKIQFGSCRLEDFAVSRWLRRGLSHVFRFRRGLRGLAVRGDRVYLSQGLQPVRLAFTNPVSERGL